MKVSKAFAEDFDRSFRHMKFEGVIIEKAKGTRTRCTSTSDSVSKAPKVPSVPDELRSRAVSKRGRPKKIR